MRAFAQQLKEEWWPRKRTGEAGRPREGFGTASERNLGSFLEPFGLHTLTDTVWKLARNGGFVDAESLHFVDDLSLSRLDIGDTDRALILLAAWLHLQQLHQYGPALVGSGFVSLTKLKGCTDEVMKRSGMRLMGHRRVLLRQIREDLALREELSDAPKASIFTSGSTSGAQYVLDLAKRREGGGSSSDAEMASSQLPGVATRPDLELKFANRETWHEPWRATADACLTCNGAGYYAPRTPREISLACEDGTVLRLC